MLKTSFFVAPLLALVLTTSFATQAPARETVGSNPLEVGREVGAPPRSAACMTDHGPSECDDHHALNHRGVVIGVPGGTAFRSHLRDITPARQ